MAGHVAGQTFRPSSLPNRWNTLSPTRRCDSVHPRSLTLGPDPSPCISPTPPLPSAHPSPLPPTGGWRSRSLAVADRDLLPQPADAEGRQEPSGRLRRPLPGVRAGAFARRGGGARSSPSAVGERRQHLRRIGRWTVRRRGKGHTRSCSHELVKWLIFVVLVGSSVGEITVESRQHVI